MKIAWIDTETGGTDPEKHALLQIAMEIFVDGKEIRREMFHVKPFNGDEIEDEALEVNGFTRDQVETFAPAFGVHKEIVKILEKYVERFNPLDKFVFAGYGARFDMDFMRAFFKKNGDDYFESYFFSLPLDVMSFVAEGIMLETVKPMKSFRLGKVCEQLGIALGEDAHDALADIRATRKLYWELWRRRKAL